jgi:hypothetical protein
MVSAKIKYFLSAPVSTKAQTMVSAKIKYFLSAPASVSIELKYNIFF